MGLSAFFALTPANIPGWLGLALLALSFQCRERVRVGLLLSAATVLLCVHYAGKEAWAAVMVTATMVPAHACGAFAGRFPVLRHAKLVILPLLWALTGSQIAGPLDTLPPLAVTIEILCLTQSRLWLMRSGFLMSQPLWVAYNVAVASGPGLIANALVFGSTAIGLWRHHLRPYLLRHTL